MKEIQLPFDLRPYQRELLNMILEDVPNYTSIKLEQPERENKDLNYPIVRRLFHVHTENEYIRYQLIPPYKWDYYNEHKFLEKTITYLGTPYKVIKIALPSAKKRGRKATKVTKE